MRLRIQLVIAAENFGREEDLSPAVIPTMSKDMDEQIELAHKVIDVVDRAKRKICDCVEVECGQARDFLCSSPVVFQEERGRNVQTKCLCEKNLQKIFIYLI